jgi:hypothetical protein
LAQKLIDPRNRRRIVKCDERKTLRWIVDKLKTHSHAWPFLNPVAQDTAPQYDEIITEPMDLATLEANADAGKHPTLGLLAPTNFSVPLVPRALKNAVCLLYWQLQ